MKYFFLTATLIFFGINAIAQSFEVGTAEYTFFDSERSRTIPALIYYPSNTAGENTAPASSQFGFPVVSFGHGFVIEPAAYSWLGEVLATNGYIMVLPATEGQLLPAPDHLNFGRDIRFCAEEIIRLSELNGNPLSGKVLPRYAMMGHSMGGGATYLGAAESDEVVTTITFAAADTDPSAISAAANVSVPSLVIAAEEDCVTPVSSNQSPMFENIPSGEKSIVTIDNASHCNFTDGTASLCYLGEAFPCIGSGPFIPREQQHERVLELLLPWLDQYLRSNCSSGELFLTEVQEGVVEGKWTSQVLGDDALLCSADCDTPQSVVISEEGSGFVLNWQPVEDALGYQVQSRLNGNIIGSVNSFSTFFSVPQLDNALNYQFRVRAFCPTQGLGSFSSWQSGSALSLSLNNQDGLTLNYSSIRGLANITIQNISGEELMKHNVTDSNGYLDISALSKGFYVARIQNSFEIEVLKFSIQ
jgi:predicted dienelactone hydrolase